MRYRIEKDKLGEVRVPLEAYYGSGAQRSKDLFQVTKHGLIRQMIRSFASIKKSAAKANADVGLLDKKIENAISLACDEITNGRLHGQFITDIVQGGSGIAMNQNANEIIANRANEILGGEKGKYNFVSPDMVNLNQDDINIVLLAGKFSTIRLTKKMVSEGKKLLTAINEQIEKTTDSITLQVLLSQINNFERESKRVSTLLQDLLEINLVARENMDIKDPFVTKFNNYLIKFVGEKTKQIKNPLIFERGLVDFAYVSGSVKSIMGVVAKGASDLLKLEAEGKLKITYDGTMTIEVVKQILLYIIGNDSTIQRASESGELDKNIYIPIVFACLFETTNLVRRVFRAYRENVIEKLEIN